jgi:hypothetical protein
MPRTVLVSVLIFSALLQGCAGSQRAVRSEPADIFTQAAAAPPPQEDWLDQHPVVKTAGYSFIGVMALVGVVATAGIIALAASAHSGLSY